MRPGGAVKVLVAGLLTGGLIATGATPALARPHTAVGAAAQRTSILTARLAAPYVVPGEPAALVATLGPPAAQQPVTVERLVDGEWTTVGAADTTGRGRVVVGLDTSLPGTQTLRAVATTSTGRVVALSRAVRLTVTDGSGCVPKVAPVDPDATPATTCLAARLDRWGAAGLMGVGQQLNMSNDRFDAPLNALGDRRVAVVGFDLWELGKTKTYDYPFFDRAFAALVARAREGAVLTASWHAANPHTDGEYHDRGWHDLDRLLRPDTAEARTFWADFDEQLTVLAALQTEGVPVVFRPLHEANGDWFWWGRPAPATYKRLWRLMQQRAAAAGVHNLLWSYSFAAADRTGITAPERLLPGKVDVAGIDTYYPATGAHRSVAPSMRGYDAVAKRVPRMAFTEIGPAADDDGSWRAPVITAVAKAAARKPLWSMLWVDDGTGIKQISSLRTGPAWLDSCPNAFCLLR